jgi:hypothetical protein
MPVPSQNGVQKGNVPSKQDSGAAQQQAPQIPAVSKGGDQGRPAPQPKHNGLTFAPTFSDIFNFYDGATFDPAGNSMTSGSDRMAQAREINANVPSDIQSAFNDNSMTYYLL